MDVLQQSVYWIVIDSEPDGGTIKTAGRPEPGGTIHLHDGTACIVNRVDPPPAGSHLMKGIVFATRA